MKAISFFPFSSTQSHTHIYTHTRIYTHTHTLAGASQCVLEHCVIRAGDDSNSMFVHTPIHSSTHPLTHIHTHKNKSWQAQILRVPPEHSVIRAGNAGDSMFFTYPNTNPPTHSHTYKYANTHPGRCKCEVYRQNTTSLLKVYRSLLNLNMPLLSVYRSLLQIQKYFDVCRQNITWFSREMQAIPCFSEHPPPHPLALTHIHTYAHSGNCECEKRSQNPPEKLLGDGVSTPMPLFCLICTMISNKTCILD